MFSKLLFLTKRNLETADPSNQIDKYYNAFVILQYKKIIFVFDLSITRTPRFCALIVIIIQYNFFFFKKFALFFIHKLRLNIKTKLNYRVLNNNNVFYFIVMYTPIIIISFLFKRNVRFDIVWIL